jgi:hypothetical protein
LISSSEIWRLNSTFYPPNHPINQLNEIENSLFGCHGLEKEVDLKSKGKKKKRQNEEMDLYIAEGRFVF